MISNAIRGKRIQTGAKNSKILTQGNEGDELGREYKHNFGDEESAKRICEQGEKGLGEILNET